MVKLKAEAIFMRCFRIQYICKLNVIAGFGFGLPGAPG